MKASQLGSEVKVHWRAVTPHTIIDKTIHCVDSVRAERSISTEYLKESKLSSVAGGAVRDSETVYTGGGR